MCLAIPGQILRIDRTDPSFPVAEVRFGDAVKRVNMLYLPDAQPGSYIVVHAGFATAELGEVEALEALELSRMELPMESAPIPPPDPEPQGSQRQGSGREEPVP